MPSDSYNEQTYNEITAVVKILYPIGGFRDNSVIEQIFQSLRKEFSYRGLSYPPPSTRGHHCHNYMVVLDIGPLVPATFTKPGTPIAI
jgi:hypothetical protein